MPSASARDLYAKYRDRLVQVRLMLKSASEQSISGSGFVVQPDEGKGCIVGHQLPCGVPHSPLVRPNTGLNFRQTNDALVEADLIAIDGRGDLAVLRTKSGSQPGWRAKTTLLSCTIPPAKAKTVSLGHPMGVAFPWSPGVNILQRAQGSSSTTTWCSPVRSIRA